LSVNERVADAAPTAVGAKVTTTVQVPPAATAVEVEQVVADVLAKGAESAEMALKLKFAFPVLVTVTV